MVLNLKHFKKFLFTFYNNFYSYTFTGGLMKLSRFYLCLAAAGLASVGLVPSAFAADDNTQKMLQQINERMAQLQSQVAGLQGQVKVLKTQLRQEKLKNNPNALSEREAFKNTIGKSYEKSRKKHLGASIPANSQNAAPNNPAAAGQSYSYNDKANQGNNLRNRPYLERSTEDHLKILNTMFATGTPVFSSPYIGINSAFDGSDLIVNESSVNFDYRLLKQIEAYQQYLIQQGLPLPAHPVLEISGKLEAQSFYDMPSPGKKTFDLDLTGAALDVFVGINPYVNGFLDLQYDNTSNLEADGDRMNNSRVYLRQGFVTIGRLSEFPGYASIGQLFVPFGQYSSYLLTDPVTKTLGRTKARALVLGYRPDDGLYGAAYVFKGNTDVSREAEGGGSLGYKHTYGQLDTNISAGLISNLGESEGMQATSGSAYPNIPFIGYAYSVIGSDYSNAENLKHSVPGFNANASLSYGNYSLLAEYVRALRKFDPTDMSFNNRGAQPQGFHTEGIYSFSIYDKPSSFVVGYDFTQDALALLLPRDRIWTALNVSPWKDTIATLEYRHDIEYNAGNVATGGGSAPFSAPSKKDDAVTLQFGVYF